MNSKTFYATPGANDFFLRPPKDHGWSPRQIGVCFNGGKNALASWIHRKAEREYPVVCEFKRGLGKGILNELKIKDKFFSKPVVFKFKHKPMVALASGDGKNLRINIFSKLGNQWILTVEAATQCSAVYHMDAIQSGENSFIIAYSGTSTGKRGTQVFSREFKNGQPEGKELHFFKDASVNRPRLAVDKSGKIFLAADVYSQKSFGIYVKILNQAESSWEQVSPAPLPNEWHMFPSIISDANGEIWISWLKEKFVERELVMGCSHSACGARYRDRKWEQLKDGESFELADLNFGLLPVKRYFGYDGLRRYPRLFAVENGDVWLFWEQQKDEKEIWENLANGYLCARQYRHGEWSKPLLLCESGSCFSIDEKNIYPASDLTFFVKDEHNSKSGNNFAIRKAGLEKLKKLNTPKAESWKAWKPAEKIYSISPHIEIESPSDGKLKLFWGDLHCHSVLSPDAEGEPDELFHFARDIAKIDFSCICDNDFYPNKALLDSEVFYESSLASGMTDEKFLALCGYEWTFHRPDKNRSFNHRIIVFPPGRHKIGRRIDASARNQKAMRKFLEDNGFFAFPHHAYWKLFDSPWEWGVEVSSAWGTYIIDSETVYDALNAGKKFAFMGCSDSHRFMPGLSGALTGVYSEELSWEKISKAIRKRHTFATTGNRTALVFKCHDAIMGDSINIGSSPLLQWEIYPFTELEKLEIIKNGKVVFSSSATAGEWEDKEISNGRNWYVLQAKEKGEHIRHPHNVAMAWGKYAWSSPIWITKN